MADKLTIQIDGDVKKYQDALKLAQDETKNLEDQLTSIAKGSAIAFAGLGAAIIGAVNEASKIETMTTKFEVLTGSVGQATRLVKDLQKFAASTPFQLEGIGKATSQLLGFGFSVNEVKQKLQEIGDVAAASGRPMEEISLIYGQVGAAGKLTGERLLQFQERAIPIGPALAKSMGVAESSIKKLVSEGKVDFATFEKAFASISEKGGQAFGGMEKLSLTLAGKISTLKDNFSLLSANIGKELLPMFKSLADAGLEGFKFLQANPELIKMTANFLKYGAAITGTVAILATASVAVLKFSAIIGTLGGLFLSSTVTASAFWVAVTGPIGIAVAGIALVVGGVTALWAALKNDDATNNLKEVTKELEIQKTALKNLDEFMAKSSKNANAHNLQRREAIVEEIARLQELRSEKETHGDLDTELSRLSQKAFEEKKARVAEEKTVMADAKQAEFDEALAKFEENSDIMTEAELVKAEEAAVLKEEADLIVKAKILENQGKHDQALALMADFKLKKEIEAAKKRKTDAEKFATIEKKLEIDTANAKIGLVGKTAQLINTIVGKETKVGFALAQVAAAAQVLMADGQARASATAASAAASLVAVPGTNAAVFAANMATYNSLITANTALSLGIIGAQTVQGFAAGGLVTGGIPGRDSVPIMAQRGELVVPAQNFDDVVSSAAQNLDGGGGGNLNLVISYDSEEASQIVTVRQNEDSALGISQDSFKEAV